MWVRCGVEGEPAEQRAAVPTTEERSPESVRKVKPDQHRSHRPVTCSHGALARRKANVYVSRVS